MSGKMLAAKTRSRCNGVNIPIQMNCYNINERSMEKKDSFLHKQIDKLNIENVKECM